MSIILIAETEIDVAGADADAPIRMQLTGEMGSGKGFISDYLASKHGAVRWSRTELMKRLAHAVVDHLGDADAILAKLFFAEDEREEVRQDLLVYANRYEREPGKPRRLYQDITQICQEHDPFCFERELAQRIDSVGVCAFSLVDDVRSIEALEFFQARGYVSVRIYAEERVRRQRMLERDGYVPSKETFSHISETALREIPHDYVLDNSADDPTAIYAEVDALVASLRESAL
jgi:dephospho-CoA kinase